MILEIVSTRLLAAPRDVIFHLFREPAVLARWSTPEGFGYSLQELDFRPGRHWSFSLQPSEGAPAWRQVQFVEVAEPERLVLRHLTDARFETTVELTPRGERSLLTCRLLFGSADDYEKAERLGLASIEQAMDRLQAELTKRLAPAARSQCRVTPQPVAQ